MGRPSSDFKSALLTSRSLAGAVREQGYLPLNSGVRHTPESGRETLENSGMSEDEHRFLGLLGQLPARLTVEQAAWVLNCRAHDVPVLVASKLLKPLGHPPANGVKFFATADLLELVKDRSWLAKVTNAVSLHWQRKNARKSVHQRRTSLRELPGLTDSAATVSFQAAAGCNGEGSVVARRFS